MPISSWVLFHRQDTLFSALQVLSHKLSNATICFFSFSPAFAPISLVYI